MKTYKRMMIVKRVLDAEDIMTCYSLDLQLVQRHFFGDSKNFRLGIIEYKKGVYFGSNTTNRILDVLEEKRPKIICIDELDKRAKVLLT